MKRNFGNLGKKPGKKLLLLAGVGLCGLVVLEASQQMVKAFDLKNVPAHLQTNPPIAAPPAPGEALIARSPQAAQQAAAQRSQPQGSQPQSSQSVDFSVKQPNASQNASQSAQRSVALNTGGVNDPQQPISQASADQLAAAGEGWLGASFPVEDFQAYTSPFGYRQSATGDYSHEFHYGLDMAAPEGSYVRNWWSGTVVEVTDDTNCGTSVVLESGNWTHIYCHMQGHVEEDANGQFLIDREGGVQIYVGQQVPAGSRIGRVGMTGRTTGPHLHWGLKFDGNWVDPAYVLQAMYAGQQETARAGGDRVQ
jgi:murein DD-endopeptidase MepM/ murein hydrolase activator NlpD